MVWIFLLKLVPIYKENLPLSPSSLFLWSILADEVLFRLGGLVDNLSSLSDLVFVSKSFATLLNSDALKSSFWKWATPMIHLKFDAKLELQPQDIGFITDSLDPRYNTSEWVMTK